MRPVAFALLAAFASFALSACSSDFDPGDFADKLDFFHLNEKKKLPGERKELFPGGVPGVEQGIPPDLVKGYQAPQTPPETQEAQTPPAQAEKPKPKPRVVHRAPPKKQPAQVKVTPQSQQTQQQQQAQQQQVWPDPKPQQPQAQQQTGAQSPWPAQPQPQQTSPWPAAPPPNTFQH
jgi:hypothetical protein